MVIPYITGKKIGLRGAEGEHNHIPLISGEVHYWRLDPAAWRDVLQPVKELGLPVVSTYVCWDFHETTRGHFDFSGETDPRRNLLGFLDLLSAEGFWVLIRPGPYIYSEWRNGGVPDYVAGYHRLDPAFQTLARPYMQAVVAALRPHFATQGGRILLFQADNEVDPWPHWYTEQLGLGNSPGPFQDFLRQCYGDITELNTAWGTGYPAFEAARATAVLLPGERDRLPRYLDFTRFQHWYGTQAARWTVAAYRELGVDIPIYLNTYSGFSTQHWADLEELADLAGPDLYPSREFAQRPNEHRNFIEAVRYTRAYSSLPYIPELESGIWHGWHYEVGALGPNHYRLMCLSALLGGIAGWNWYMLVNRDNWYMSPINEWGRKRPELFTAFQQLVRLYQELDPPALTKLAQTAVTHDPLQRGTERPGQELLQALYEADIDYEFFDVNQGECSQPLLFYAGGAWLSVPAQERLRRYVLEGGHLVCLGAYPRLDDRLRPHNALGIVEPAGILSGAIEKLRLDLAIGPTATPLGIVDSPWLGSYTTVPGEPVLAERRLSGKLTAEELSLQTNLQAGARYTVGYTQESGRGRLTVLGLSPSPELLLALHRYFHIGIPARSVTPGVATAFFQRGQEHYLIAVNNTDQSLTANIELELQDSGPLQITDLTTDDSWNVDRKAPTRIVFPLPRKDGTVLRF